MNSETLSTSTTAQTSLLSDLMADKKLWDYLNEGTPLAQKLMEETEQLCYNAFINKSAAALYQINWILHKKYTALLNLPLDFTVVCNLKHPLLTEAIGLIENSWGINEEERAELILNSCKYKGTLKERILQLVSRHKASRHPLFDLLATEASRSKFVSFFEFDYALNMRFFDLVALALPGLTGRARQEVVQNIWDESGRGMPENSRTIMYERITSALLEGFDPEAMISRMGYEALAGMNLFSYLGLNRMNFYRYLGCLAATEILDPPQYDKLLAGAKRIGLNEEVDLAYYSEHATIDIAHAAGWLDNIMTPLAASSEKIAMEMLIGVLMRLNTCSDYYDMLIERLDS